MANREKNGIFTTAKGMMGIIIGILMLTMLPTKCSDANKIRRLETELEGSRIELKRITLRGDSLKKESDGVYSKYVADTLRREEQYAIAIKNLKDEYEQNLIKKDDEIERLVVAKMKPRDTVIVGQVDSLGILSNTYPDKKSPFFDVTVDPYNKNFKYKFYEQSITYVEYREPGSDYKKVLFKTPEFFTIETLDIYAPIENKKPVDTNKNRPNWLGVYIGGQYNHQDKTIEPQVGLSLFRGTVLTSIGAKSVGIYYKIK